MNGLILHCGARAIDRTALYALPEPEPMGRFHAPIHHADFIEQVEGTIVDHGYDIVDQAFGVTNEGARLFGLMSVQHQALAAFDGGEFVIGFRGSHDQSLPRGLAAGSRIFVCDNLAFSGEVVMHTKQTTNLHLRLPMLLDEMVATLGLRFESQVKQFESYRGTQITDGLASQALVHMARNGVINWSELGKVDEQWRDPAHAEHAEDGASVWRLFNAATQVMKIRNKEHPRLPQLAPKTQVLHDICDELVAA